MLISGFDSVLCDLDGVVYAGANAIDHAVESLNSLAEIGVSLAFITNNAGRSPMSVAAHLTQLGVKARAEQIFGSADAGAEMLAREINPGSKVLVVGSPYLRECLTVRGLEVVETHEANPVAVIQGFDPNVSWQDLAGASFAIANGATWVATNTDLTIPRAEGIAPGNGSLVQAVGLATGKTPRVAGKPEAYLFTRAADQMGSHKPLVIGDRLDTDILGGQRAGFATALVLTGVDTLKTALSAPAGQRPNYIVPTLADLYRSYPTTKVLGYGVQVGEAIAAVSGDKVKVCGAESELNTWRAICQAWWMAHPKQRDIVEPKVIFAPNRAEMLRS